ncbi:phosphonate C-P lyase system protein PhnG, partial [Mesorhizobium sp. M2D.F.Ca.ET.232.01.1.1]
MRGQEARDQAERKAAMATLAQSSGDDIVRLWNEAALPAEAELLRGPETGLVTLRRRRCGR